MTPDVFLATICIVVGLPVTLGIASDVYKRRLAFKEKELDAFSRQTAERAAQYAAQSERLEQRVRVLERIATEKGTVLSDEIEALRDARVN